MEIPRKKIKLSNGKEIEIPVVPYENSVFKLFDDAFMAGFKINDAQYDYLCEHATDEELEAVTGPFKTFAERRKAVMVRDKYVKLEAESRNESGLGHA